MSTGKQRNTIAQRTVQQSHGLCGRGDRGQRACSLESTSIFFRAMRTLTLMIPGLFVLASCVGDEPVSGKLPTPSYDASVGQDSALPVTDSSAANDAGPNICSAIVSYWAGEGDAKDQLAANSLTPIDENYVEFGIGRFGKAFRFPMYVPNSAQARYRADVKAIVPAPSGITMLAWVSARKGPASFFSLGKKDVGLSVGAASNGTWSITLGAVSASPAPMFPLGTDTSIAVTVQPDPLGNKVGFYVNGGSETTFTVDKNPVLEFFTTGSTVQIGGNDAAFGGYVDELVLFNRVLSENEIALAVRGLSCGGPLQAVPAVTPMPCNPSVMPARQSCLGTLCVAPQVCVDSATTPGTYVPSCAMPVTASVYACTHPSDCAGAGSGFTPVCCATNVRSREVSAGVCSSKLSQTVQGRCTSAITCDQPDSGRLCSSDAECAVFGTGAKCVGFRANDAQSIERVFGMCK
jgi:Concanavalin A-like lectin/glucanases superfamily